MPVLQIVVASACQTCDEAHRLAGEVKTRFPQVTVDVINLDTTPERRPDSVFAVPTYLLNEHVISLGNPSEEALYDLLKADMQSAGALAEADTGS